MVHLTLSELQAGLDAVLASPRDEGRLRLIVRRPRIDEREVLEEAELDLAEGLVGDYWSTSPDPDTPDGAPDPARQLNIMNARVIALLAQREDRWALAGDQLYIDLDLSAANLPPGTRLAVGDAVIEITDRRHTGCSKFARRFGPEATKFVNSPRGLELRLRGACTRVIRDGRIRAGCEVRKLPGHAGMVRSTE